eukprot:g16021.t1
MGDETKKGLTVLVCGGGNAAQVATSMFAARYETYAISLYADEAAKWKTHMMGSRWHDKVEGMELTLDTGRKLISTPSDISNDPSLAGKADVIILAVPSFAHGQYFEAFYPYIKAGTIVACMPARSGGDILFASKMKEKADSLAFVGFETLPWACRFTEWGKRATILGTKGQILAAVTPESEATRAIATLQGLLGVFPAIEKSPNNLGISLRNPGQVIHPGVMYGRWCSEKWDGKPLAEKPLFYQGVDDFTEKVLLGLSDEVQDVCRKVEALVPGFNLKDACTLHRWYLDSYKGQMADDSTLKLSMNTNSAYVGLTHPMNPVDGGFMPDLKYRYLAEDVPTGLCFTRGLAELLEVPTPTIDKVIMFAQVSLGKSFLVDGKMAGARSSSCAAPGEFCLNEFCSVRSKKQGPPLRKASSLVRCVLQVQGLHIVKQTVLPSDASFRFRSEMFCGAEALSRLCFETHGLCFGAGECPQGRGPWTPSTGQLRAVPFRSFEPAVQHWLALAIRAHPAEGTPGNHFVLKLAPAFRTNFSVVSLQSSSIPDFFSKMFADAGQVRTPLAGRFQPVSAMTHSWTPRRYFPSHGAHHVKPAQPHVQQGQPPVHLLPARPKLRQPQDELVNLQSHLKRLQDLQTQLEQTCSSDVGPRVEIVLDRRVSSSVSLQVLLYCGVWFDVFLVIVEVLAGWAKLRWIRGTIMIALLCANYVLCLLLEPCRLYLGYAGNLGEKVPELFLFVFLCLGCIGILLRCILPSSGSRRRANEMPFVRDHSTRELLQQDAHKTRRDAARGSGLEDVDEEAHLHGGGFIPVAGQPMPQTQRKLPPSDVVMVFPYKAASCASIVANFEWWVPSSSASRCCVEADLMEAESCRDKWSIRKTWRNGEMMITELATAFLARQKEALKFCVEAGYEEVAIEGFYDEFMEMAAKVSEGVSTSTLEAMWEENDNDRYLVCWARVLTSAYLKRHEQDFASFLTSHSSIQQFCAQEAFTPRPSPPSTDCRSRSPSFIWIALRARRPSIPLPTNPTHSTLRWGDAAAEEEQRGLRQPIEEQIRQMESWKAKRNMVIHSLSDTGLVLMLYYSRDRDEIFVRIAADPLHLRQVAEMIRYQLELKPQYLSAFADYKNDYPGRRDLNYSDRCIVSHLYETHFEKSKEGDYPQKDAIFRTVDRLRLIDHIVRSGDHNCAGVDVGQLLHDGDLIHYFPLHEQRELEDMDKDWFKTFVMGRNIHKVRDYFGERIALYFLFMSHFIKWMIIPTIFGTFLCVVDLFYQTPNNVTTNLYALKWGTFSMKKKAETTRPEFYGVSRVNPVTSRVDRYYPWSERIWKVLFSYSVILVSLISLFFAVGILMVLRHTFHKHGGRITFQVINALVVELLNTLFTSLATWLTELRCFWPCVVAMRTGKKRSHRDARSGEVGGGRLLRLKPWQDRENHRSYSEHANHLLAKMVVFKFINCYVSLYYIAFLKEHSYLFGMPMTCVNDDCLNDLGSQLAIFMIMRLTLQNMIELGGPYAVMMYRRMTEESAFNFDATLFTNPMTIMPDLSSPEKQSKKEDYDVYQDMDEVSMS